MGPKRATTTAAAAAAKAADEDRVVQWLYRNDDPSIMMGWTQYSDEDATNLEAGYHNKLKRVDIGHGYFVDIPQMIQYRATDMSRRRPVKRFVGRLATATDGPLVTTKSWRKESGSQVAAVMVSASAAPPAPAKAESKSATQPTTPIAAPLHAASASPPPTFFRPSGGNFAIIGGAILTGLQTQAPPTPTSGRNPEYTRMPWRSVAAIVSRVLADTKVINRTPLDIAAKLMHPATRQWLQQLGRPMDEKFMGITLSTPLEARPKNMKVAISPVAQIACGVLQNDATAAVFSHFGPPPSSGTLIVNAAKLTAEQHEEALRMMISGPVQILYDGDYVAIPNPPSTVICSTPGINFSYSKVDVTAFTTQEGPGEPRLINKALAVAHMKAVWAHVLTVMDGVYKVQFPVLCAIGCGAFRGKFGSLVPRLWAEALHAVLSTQTFSHIHTVFLSAPTFGDTNNFAPFKAVIEAAAVKAPLCVPLVIIEDASMISIATILAKEGFSSGILNPSDVEALRKGWVGMYWDGGHIAVEEILAMQTTLLVHHVGVNPTLYTDVNRRLIVDLK